MGITYCDAMAYLTAKRQGASFGRTLTLGRQQLYLHRREVKALRNMYRAKAGEWPKSLAGCKWGDYADDFLREFLDISALTVLDASSYQGADRIHDMNLPLPGEWSGEFDAVIECGSLEHIFNVPVALSNLANLLKVGGSLFITTPANNLTGHGFYQFSPELMFRVFSTENGFKTLNLTLREASFPSVELTRTRKLYSVVDPQVVRQRVGLISKKPTVMLVEAKKLANIKFLSRAPLQSDYVTIWQEGKDDSNRGVASPQKPNSRRALRKLVDLLPRPISSQITGRYGRRRFSLGNKEFYRRVPLSGSDPAGCSQSDVPPQSPKM